MTYEEILKEFESRFKAKDYIKSQQLDGRNGGIKYIQSIVDCDNDTALKILIEIGEFRKVDHFKTEEDMTHTSSSKPTVQCPYCKSTNTHKITTTSKVVNTALFGLFGTKRNKQWHCDSCGSEW